LAEVFAGFVCGYLLALLTAPLLALHLFRARASDGLVARMLPVGTSPIALVVVLHGVLFLLWTGAGLILGMVLFAMRDSGGALGSPNGPFTLFVAALTLMLASPFVVVMARLREVVVPMAVAALLVFGWLMPHLAGWTKFGSS
jgi:hypothetical protein